MGLSSPFHGDGFLIPSLCYFLGGNNFYVTPQCLFAFGTLNPPYFIRPGAHESAPHLFSCLTSHLILPSRSPFHTWTHFLASSSPWMVDHVMVFHRDRPVLEVRGRARRENQTRVPSLPTGHSVGPSHITSWFGNQGCEVRGRQQM